MLKLPEGIDPAMPVGQLNDEQLMRLSQSIAAQVRWSGTTAEERSAHARKMAAARKVPAARRREIARQAGRQRAINAGQKLRDG